MAKRGGKPQTLRRSKRTGTTTTTPPASPIDPNPHNSSPTTTQNPHPSQPSTPNPSQPPVSHTDMERLGNMSVGEIMALDPELFKRTLAAMQQVGKFLSYSTVFMH